MRRGPGTGLGPASRRGSGGPWPICGPAGTARRSRGSRPPRRGVRPGRRPPRCGWRSRCPRRGRLRRSRCRRKWSAGPRGRRPGRVRRMGDLVVGQVAEDTAPAERVHLAGPDAGPVSVLAAGDAGVAVVEHGADQQLRGNRRGAQVAGQQGDAAARPPPALAPATTTRAGSIPSSAECSAIQSSPW